jgi:hypothetical protein
MVTYRVQSAKFKMHVKDWDLRVKIKKMSHTYAVIRYIPSTKSCKDWAFRVKIKKDYDQIVAIHKVTS